MADIFWKFGDREYLVNEYHTNGRLSGMFNDFMTGQYDRDYVNVETICKFYNFLRLKGLNLAYSLSAVITAWQGYEKALELLEKPPKNEQNLTTNYKYFNEIYMVFEPRAYDGWTTEMINERMFELATKKGSFAKALEYAKLIGNKDCEELSSSIHGRYYYFITRLGLTMEDIIAFSTKYPYINMNSVYEVFDEKEKNRFTFVNYWHALLGELLYEERPKQD